MRPGGALDPGGFRADFGGVFCGWEVCGNPTGGPAQCKGSLRPAYAIWIDCSNRLWPARQGSRPDRFGVLAASRRARTGHLRVCGREETVAMRSTSYVALGTLSSISQDESCRDFGIGAHFEVKNGFSEPGPTGNRAPPGHINLADLRSGVGGSKRPLCSCSRREVIQCVSASVGV